VTFALWEGVYWDERGYGRACILVMLDNRVISALDAETREPLRDPPAAIPLHALD
jgi:hypothetical protein